MAISRAYPSKGEINIGIKYLDSILLPLLLLLLHSDPDQLEPRLVSWMQLPKGVPRPALSPTINQAVGSLSFLLSFRIDNRLESRRCQGVLVSIGILLSGVNKHDRHVVEWSHVTSRFSRHSSSRQVQPARRDYQPHLLHPDSLL